jgi:hypothetical protein
MALHWAEALDRAAHAIPRGRASDRQPYATWIETNRPYIVYFEQAGTWMLRREAILNLHRRYPAMDAADDIAWLLVTVGVVRECEGDVPCYVEWKDATYGEYLRLHNTGRHADDATAHLLEWVTSMVRKGPPHKDMFDPARNCGALKRAAGALRAAVARSAGYRHEEVVKGLDELLGWCR